MWTHQWPHLREQLKRWWDQLTDTDLEQVVSQATGQRDHLIRVVQAKYGYARERAEQEVNQRLEEYRGTTEGVAARAARTVADTAAKAGAYLPEAPRDLAGLIHRYPIATLLLGLGVGFLLGSSLRGAQGAPWIGGRRESHENPTEAGYPDAMIQCTRCGQMVLQADIVQHSLECTGSGQPGYGGSPA
jgi:uncharacterized protein YjbJ (UPF0337 family)